MFVPTPIATPIAAFAGRSRAALAAARSLLLLEDDANVDWEVDQEPAAARPHPHRERLRAPSRRPGARRAGQPPAAEQVCLCPLRGAGGPRPARPTVTVSRIGAHRHARTRETSTCATSER